MFHSLFKATSLVHLLYKAKHVVSVSELEPPCLHQGSNTCLQCVPNILTVHSNCICLLSNKANVETLRLVREKKNSLPTASLCWSHMQKVVK